MKQIRSFVGGIAQNIIANLLAPIVSIAVISMIVLGLYFLRENLVVALLTIIIILLIPTTIQSIRSLRPHAAPQINQPHAALAIDQVGNSYILDTHRRLRKIPDEDTLSYMFEMFGERNTEAKLTENELKPLLGADLPSIKKWKRPLTQEEQEQQKLQRKIQDMIEMVDFHFYEASNPQKFVITVKNRGEETLYIPSASFVGSGIPTDAIVSPTKDGIRSKFSIEKSIKPDQEIILDLPLTQKWSYQQIQTKRGSIGFLTLYIIYSNQTVECLIMF